MRTANVKPRPRAVHLQLLFMTSVFIQSGLGKRESGRQATVQPARKTEPEAFASLFDGLVVRRPNSLESSPLATEGKCRAWSRCTGRLVRGLIHGDDEAKRALPWSSFRRAIGVSSLFRSNSDWLGKRPAMTAVTGAVDRLETIGTANPLPTSTPSWSPHAFPTSLARLALRQHHAPSVSTRAPRWMQSLHTHLQL